MSSWHFHNAFFVPCPSCNQRVRLFSPLLFVTLIRQQTSPITCKQVAKQSNQSKLKPNAINSKWLTGVQLKQTRSFFSFFFFIPAKALHFLQVQVALHKKSYRTSRTTPTNSIMNPAVPLGHGTIGKKEKKNSNKNCEIFCIQTQHRASFAQPARPWCFRVTSGKSGLLCGCLAHAEKISVTRAWAAGWTLYTVNAAQPWLIQSVLP